MVSRGVRGSSGVAGGLAVLAGCALLAGCGGPSAPPAPASPSPSARASGEALAARVCGGARQAAAKALGSPLTARIVSPAAASLQCLLTGHQVQVSVGSQAGPRAYTEFDTETSHQEQVYGNGGVHDPGQFPTAITVPGSVVAVWIPAQLLLVATNATPTTGGAYVTVAVKGRAAPAKIALRVATAAARATFAAHPNGPS
ncbi:MAG TPA: hypothetical protein VGM53_04570 [Streptosporangiaceae bacterium]|jgi:hypothetical protein